MCDFGIIIGLASAAVGAAGSMQQAAAAKASADYNAQIAKQNARISQQRAHDAIERGKVAEQQKMGQNSQLLGKQRAALAANGVDLSFGSPLDLQVDTAVVAKTDALTIKTNAYREAYDHEIDAHNQTAQARLYRMQGNAAAQAGTIGAIGTVLGGAGDAWKSYAKTQAA